jgi:hypothetical protein
MDWIRRKPTHSALFLGLGLLILVMAGCGSDEDPVDPGNGNNHAGPDTTAPATVTDMRLRSPTQNTLALAWTSPGDDGTKGTAARYDIRFSKALITEANWDQAAPLDPQLVPTPKPGGQIETIVVTSLESGTMYYFALKADDEVPNQSGLSNCCSEATLAETLPPSDIKNLEAVAIDGSSIELTWTAPGDDFNTGTATRYEIRRWPHPISNEADWTQALIVNDPPPPRPAGESESFVVTGLPAGTHCFAMKTVDELDNWSGLSNLAIGLGYSELFWFYPFSLSVGEYLYITFRAYDSGFTRISLHDPYGAANCGERLVMDIVRETLPGGVYAIKFDFIDKDTGHYLPAELYALSLCYAEYLQKWQWVHLNE